MPQTTNCLSVAAHTWLVHSYCHGRTSFQATTVDTLIHAQSNHGEHQVSNTLLKGRVNPIPMQDSNPINRLVWTSQGTKELVDQLIWISR